MSNEASAQAVAPKAYLVVQRGDAPPTMDAVSLDDLCAPEAYARYIARGATALAALCKERGVRVPKNALYMHDNGKIFGPPGSTPLKTEVAKRLIEAGADVNNDNEPVYAAAYYNDVELMNLLFEHGAVPTGIALEAAVRQNSPDAARLLIDRMKRDESYSTVLKNIVTRCMVIGLENEHMGMVDLMIQNGADIHSKTIFDNAIINASARGRVAPIAFLLDHGADIEARGRHWTCLMHAIAHNKTDAVRLLLERGANVHATTILSSNEEDFALRMAVSVTSPVLPIVELLLKHGADARANNDTPMRRAVENGNVELIELLLKHGAVLDDKMLEGAPECVVAFAKARDAKKSPEETLRLAKEAFEAGDEERVRQLLAV